MFFCVVLCLLKSFTLDSMSMHESDEHVLGGGFKHLFMFTPKIREDEPIWTKTCQWG